MTLLQMGFGIQGHKQEAIKVIFTCEKNYTKGSVLLVGTATNGK